MTTTEIETKVIQIVANQYRIPPAEITRSTHRISDLNSDSLDDVEIVMEFEDEFDLSIRDEDAEKWNTVGDVIDYIAAELAKR